ncbi:rhamnogalacturonan endolyase [Marchantia polymorpha subsp. ruderalis]|uniref:rhamnogalacturonan endolyase n=2 Tax=Marchantia polymorpha TaxID=3197 RepID=A0AAF6BYJ1_MARPO|nr:hypothetical protein MARPO_0003s0188 [Marchantia polymorpha]BBN17075.1 hypothetical protein Mp_7g11760 [Marchantia polymorpha subsp. ruderalis]|eukprot:PTQ49310.1 hypothetical protein MARPO_0003s0188 [Marchantia polymorpha]
MEKKMRMGLERASLLRMVLILALGGALVQRAPRRCQGEAAAPLRGAGELVYTESAENVMLSNGRLEVRVGKPGVRGGSIQSLVYKRGGAQGDVELLDMEQRCGARGYWDMHWEYGSYITGTDYNGKCRFGDNDGAAWTTADGAGGGDQLLGVTFRQEPSSAGQARRHRVPVSTQVHYAVRRGLPGVYCTLLVDHAAGQPLMQLTELRLVLKLDPEQFDYSYVADDRQRFMPTRLDISKHRSAALAFKEARMLTRPQNKSLLFEVDHKYQYSVEARDGILHGWISSKANIGVWIISPHKWEYLAGGPNKQELTVQTGPNLLAMLHSCHYGTPAIPLEGSEQWAKAFGPFLLYVNHARDIKSLIDDAKARAALETASWPYPWVPFPEYRKPEQRGTVTGRVVKLGRYQHGPATWVGLTDALSPISNWEDEVKGHQFWNVTNAEGEFTLYNVNPGTYLLQSLVEGFLVDSSVLQTVTVKAGWVSSVGEIVLRPKQKGPTVWEIGQPDRSAAEFLIPDLDKSRDSSDASSTGGSGSGALKDGFRHYGVWDKFVELYPMADPVFVVGQSDYAKDWFFAHVNRPNRTTTQREIRFRLDAVVPGDYTLRLAIAGAHQAALEIRLNNPSGSPLHDTGAFGRDNALARAGIHGHYHEFSISLSHMNFRAGLNSLFLRQRKNQNKFSYVMYDYLRLEAPLVSPGSLLASSR